MKSIIKFFIATTLTVVLIFIGTASIYAYEISDTFASNTQSDTASVGPEWMTQELGMDFIRQFKQAEKQKQAYCVQVDASVFTPVFAPEVKPYEPGSKGACMKKCITNGGDPRRCVACCLEIGPGVCDDGGGGA